jgi:hypothetical protein
MKTWIDIYIIRNDDWLVFFFVVVGLANSFNEKLMTTKNKLKNNRYLNWSTDVNERIKSREFKGKLNQTSFGFF